MANILTLSLCISLAQPIQLFWQAFALPRMQRPARFISRPAPGYSLAFVSRPRRGESASRGRRNRVETEFYDMLTRRHYLRMRTRVWKPSMLHVLLNKFRGARDNAVHVDTLRTASQGTLSADGRRAPAPNGLV